MKIRQWLGYNEDSSQYLLRPGELRVLNNLQPRRPGMLIARKGLTKQYGRYDDEGIYGLYRRATILGEPADFLWLQKVNVPRALTLDQIAARESQNKDVWMVRRVQGHKSRVIDTQEMRPEDKTAIANFCVAEDRHGRMFIFYGHGARPRMYRPDDIGNIAVDMGLDPPITAPSVTPSGSGYFIEAVDVRSGGGAYYAPPDLTITGGNPAKPAKLKAIVQSGNIVGVEVVDGGENYQSTPNVTAGLQNIGSGFRARGNISNSGRTIDGFSATAAATVTGSAATSTETYGTTNGTAGNSIMYLATQRVATLRIMSWSTDRTAITLPNWTETISVGDIVTVTPSLVPFSNSTVTVTAVDAAASTVTLSAAPTAQAIVTGTVYEATFTRPSTVATAPAEYDSALRRFFATIPLASDSATGSGAMARLEFSPLPLGYALNTASNSSIAVANNNFYKYYDRYAKQYAPFLYGEFWVGSNFDTKGSTENILYGGLQASGSSYVKGFSGTVNKKRADVYWPNYSAISVWLCTGTNTGNANQWTRIDVPVTTETDPNTGVTSKILKFRVPPAQAGRAAVSLGGSVVQSQYTPADQLPDAVSPEVKLYLTECPDSWVVSGPDCLPSEVKEANSNRLAWWSPSSGVPRPIVGITPIGSDITADAVVITDPGSGWTSGTQFVFRLYQANPYDQYVDYNTAVVEPSVSRGHPVYDRNTQFIQFTLTANAPDNLPLHGPPNTLVGPATVNVPGTGFANTQTGRITLYKRGLADAIAAAVPAETLTWTAASLSVLSSTDVKTIGSITILNGGSNYLAPPKIEVRGGGEGYGLAVEPQVTNGKITSVRIIDPGMGYTTPPELYTSAAPAELTPVMRPVMRGKYRCAYRFVDMSETIVATVTATLGQSSNTLTLSDTSAVKPGMIISSRRYLPHFARVKSVNGNQVELNQEIVNLPAATTINVRVRDLTKPIGYSDLSPITDVDAGPNDTRSHSSLMSWSLTGVRPPPRADKVELWRTSGDQSLVFYRIEAYGIPSPDGVELVGTDTLTDEQLFDPERPHYAALPVVLPNGNLNAYRFGKPRSDLAVAVAFQDRLWMGVSTSGKNVNTLYYSGFDDFQAVPDTNDLPIQVNQKSTDVLTALVPFGSMLLAMQHQHTYSVTYSADPSVDATIQMMSHRGCLHQRCWDIHENILYAADESGIYAMSRTGEVKDISAAIRDFFVSEVIDFSQREKFFLQADPRTHVLRFFCTLVSHRTDTPAFALCFDINGGAWWSESYPNSITSACTGRPDDTRVQTILLGAVDGNVYEMDAESDHANECLTDAFITEHGSGYREAPDITVPNCEGAVVKGVVSEGRLVDVVIQSPGWAAEWGVTLLSEDGRVLQDAIGRDLQGVEYDAIKLDISPPEPGGVQAVAYVNFSVTPRVARSCTVAEGESFLRLDPARIITAVPDETDFLAAESGLILHTEDNRPICLQAIPVEPGMEATGDYIPLNSYVKRIDRTDVYLEHPDGTPVSMLYGTSRATTAGTPMVVNFYKPFRTHIPFRMATGYMQLLNEDNTRNGHGQIDRSITLVYTPTPGDKDIEMIERFNGREEMRPNLMRRDRGGEGGFRHRQDSASTVLNLNKSATRLGFATGVATARFASRAYTDLTGEDQHIQVELYARPEQASPWDRLNFWRPNAAIRPPQPVVLHSMNINGVAEENVE